METRRLGLIAILVPLLAGANEGDCSVKISEHFIRGQSMSELFQPETRIEAEEGWYACHPVKRDDIVLVRLPHRKDPLIKIAKVIPGDRFELKSLSGASYQLLINRQVAKTPKGQSYLFSGSAYKMLSLYEKDFKGVMPKDTYFVFGTQPGGSLDSAKYGPITHAALMARVRATAHIQ